MEIPFLGAESPESGIEPGPRGAAADEYAEPLHRVAERHGATVFQIALAWLLARSPAMLVIPGTSSVAHLEENVAAAETKFAFFCLRITLHDDGLRAV